MSLTRLVSSTQLDKKTMTASDLYPTHKPTSSSSASPSPHPRPSKTYEKSGSRKSITTAPVCHVS